MSEIVKALLLDLRQHPAFPELLKEIPKPQLPRFKGSDAEKPQTAQSKWIYESGRLDHYEQIVSMLTGTSKERD